MRIISGKNRGKKIIIPKNLPVRPTTDQSKESIFNIINNSYCIRYYRCYISNSSF